MKFNNSPPGARVPPEWKTQHQWNELQRANEGRGCILEVMQSAYYIYLGDKTSQKIKKGIATRQRLGKKSQSEDAAVTKETKDVANDGDVQQHLDQRTRNNDVKNKKHDEGQINVTKGFEDMSSTEDWPLLCFETC